MASDQRVSGRQELVTLTCLGEKAEYQGLQPGDVGCLDQSLSCLDPGAGESRCGLWAANC